MVKLQVYVSGSMGSAVYSKKNFVQNTRGGSARPLPNR